MSSWGGLEGILCNLDKEFILTMKSNGTGTMTSQEGLALRESVLERIHAAARVTQHPHDSLGPRGVFKMQAFFRSFRLAFAFNRVARAARFRLPGSHVITGCHKALILFVLSPSF